MCMKISSKQPRESHTAHRFTPERLMSLLHGTNPSQDLTFSLSTGGSRWRSPVNLALRSRGSHECSGAKPCFESET
jgi:hypothetical protein